MNAPAKAVEAPAPVESPKKPAGVAIKGMGTITIAKEEPPKPAEPLIDQVARDTLQKQKKKLTVFEMQLLG